MTKMTTLKKARSHTKKAPSDLHKPEEQTSPATMKPEIIVFHIVGISPLLQNNPAAFIGVDESSGLETKKVYKDEEEARMRLYVDPDGRYCHPAQAFPKAMVSAASGKKFGKMFATAALKGAVFITEPFAAIEDEKGNPLKEYSIDKRPCVVGKARILRCRPCWSNWHMRIPLEVDRAILQPSQVREVLELAGRIKGIGDYRPEKGGAFGRFRVD